jgi:hypothetical protein
MKCYLASVLTLCCMLGGCMVGPDYHLPKLAFHINWHEAKPKAVRNTIPRKRTLK